jgi:hypothetical protein
VHNWCLLHFMKINLGKTTIMSRVAQAVQCLTTGWTTGRLGFDPRQGQRIFPLASVSRPALGPTQPPVQWVPGGPFPGGKARPLTTHPHLVPRSSMSRNYTSSPLSAFMACSGTALAFKTTIVSFSRKTNSIHFNY